MLLVHTERHFRDQERWTSGGFCRRRRPGIGTRAAVVDGGHGAGRGSGPLGSGGEAERLGRECWFDVRVPRESFGVAAPRVPPMVVDWSVAGEAGGEKPEGYCAAISRCSG